MFSRRFFIHYPITTQEQKKAGLCIKSPLTPNSETEVKVNDILNLFPLPCIILLSSHLTFMEVCEN